MSESLANAPYHNPGLAVADRVADLLSRMTLAEKAAQMTCVWQQKAELLLDGAGRFDVVKARANFGHGNGLGQVGRPSDATGGLNARDTAELTNAIQRFFVSESRLGIPVFFHEECLHGQAAVDSTSFCQPIGLGATFDPDLVERLFTMTALEARVRGTHQALTPVVDVARDPRWGRVEETYGEDPYLVAQLGVAAVRGFQGDATFRDKSRVIATLKHFAAHGQPESGNNCAPVNVSERLLRETFLSTFKAAIERGGARSVMASYNEIDGVPSHASRWLLREILRRDWGFTGTVVSDYYAIREMADRPGLFGHQVARDAREAAKLAVRAGVNIELPEPDCYRNLIELVQDGTLAERELDELVAPLLAQKFQLGLFDDPYTDPAAAERLVGCDEHRKLALEAALKTMTLLKNDGGLAPLDANKIKTIAVIGPNADRELIGGYSGRPKHRSTVLEGIRAGAAGRRGALPRGLQDHDRRVLAAGRRDAKQSGGRPPHHSASGRAGGAGGRGGAGDRRQRANVARRLGAQSSGRSHQPQHGRVAGRAGGRDFRDGQADRGAGVRWAAAVDQQPGQKGEHSFSVLVLGPGERPGDRGHAIRRRQPGRQAAHHDSAVGRPPAGILQSQAVGPPRVFV